jgi:PAS domain S-box-containing protein
MKDLENRRFAGLLEAAPDAMVCVDKAGRIALVNAQAERLFGYGKQELVGQRVEVLVPDAARAVHRRHRAEYVADPKPRPMGAGMELAARRRDGSTFPAEISLSAIETDEGILVIAAVRDVTERLDVQAEREQLRTQAEQDTLERQLHQAQRLNSLSQLAGGVAHDFNNLLAVVFGREVVQPRVLNLNIAVTNILGVLQRTLGEHIELVTDLTPGLAYVLADQGHIEQILVNLAVNARDVMPGGGMLIIETRNIDVDEAYAATHANLSMGRYVAMKVSDNGPGMPPKVVDHAFEPFFTTKPKGEGSGLGLATIYGIVAQAGGNMRIYSEPAVGTTISVLLPVADQSPPPEEHPPDDGESGGSELVLVVEDEPALREVTRRILTRNCYRVITADNGSEAIRATRRCRDHIDMLLIDVIMSGMQGKEVAQRVRKLQPDVAVLYMSGYTEGLLSAQGVLEPGINLIEKPFNEKSLLRKVHEVLNARQPVLNRRWEVRPARANTAASRSGSRPSAASGGRTHRGFQDCRDARPGLARRGRVRQAADGIDRLTGRPPCALPDRHHPPAAGRVNPAPHDRHRGLAADRRPRPADRPCPPAGPAAAARPQPASRGPGSAVTEPLGTRRCLATICN